METINGVTCIKGEIHSITTLMRLNTRWSQHSRSRSNNQDESPFVQSFRRLNEYLEGIFDLREVDCVIYISPFHQVIVSDQASGPLTSAALSSLSKFAMFGFLSADYPRVREGIAMLANCICRCVFEETDWESDEVILMKLLELSTLILRSDASSLLTVGAAWDMYSTCISIHSQYKASKILRSEAETALRHLTLTAFSRAHHALKVHVPLITAEVKNFDDDHDFGFLAEVRGHSWEEMSQKHRFAGPVGITLLLGKIMTVLSGLMDLQVQNVEGVKFALSLINIALEAGGPALGSMGPLVDVLRGDICRHLLRASQSEDLAVFSLSLRVVFNLFMSIKDHMKVQLEVFLTSVHLRLLQSQQATFLSVAKEELALESLLEFCREPSLMQDLYTNYDCDVQCTNLFDLIISVLCSRSIPTGADAGGTGATAAASSKAAEVDGPTRLNTLNKLALEGVFAVLHAVAGRCANYSRGPASASASDGASAGLSSPTRSSKDAKQLISAGTGAESAGLVAGVQRAAAAAAASQAAPQVAPLSSDGLLTGGDGGSSGQLTGDDDDRLSVGGSRDVLEQQVDQWCSSEPSSPSPALGDLIGDSPVTPQRSERGELSARGMQTLSARFSSTGIGGGLGGGGGSSNETLPSLSLSRESSTDSVSLSGKGVVGLGSRLDFDDQLRAGAGLAAGEDSDQFLLLARARTAEVLRQRKLKKQRLRLAAEKFNDKPLKNEWIHFALELGLLQPYLKSPSTPTTPDNTKKGAPGSSFPPTDDGNANSTISAAATASTSSSVSSSSNSSTGDKTAAPVVAEGNAGEGQTASQAAPQAAPQAKVAQATGKKAAEDSYLADPRSVARFLKNTPGLGKTQVGEYLSKGPADRYPFHALVLQAYVDTFDFSGRDSSFVKALRTFLGHFRLPGEAQCIDRLMEAFSAKLFEHLGAGRPFASSDAAFVLAFSTIMLNTDLHNPNLPDNKRMTKEEFIRNNRGINDGKDIPKDYLETLYEEIKTRQIQVDVDINDSGSSMASMDFTDTATWNKLLHRSAAYQAPAAFTPTVAARKGASAWARAGGEADFYPSAHEKDMFLVMAKPVLDAIIKVWETSEDDSIMFRIVEGLWDYASVCVSLNLISMLDRLVQAFCYRIQVVLEASRQSLLGHPPAAGAAASRGGGGAGAAGSAAGSAWASSSSSAAYALKLRKMEAERGRRHNLGALMCSDFESLLVSPRNHGVEAATTLNWTGAVLVRGEIMVKVIFSVAHKHMHFLGGDSWRSIYSLLLWVRGRGALPPALATINDDWYENAAIVDNDISPAGRASPSALPAMSSGGLPQSQYAMQAHAIARGILPSHQPFAQGQQQEQLSSDGGSGGSIWMSVASLGGLLWSTSNSGGSGSGSVLGSGGFIDHAKLAELLHPPFDGNSSMYAIYAASNGSVAGANGSASGGSSSSAVAVPAAAAAAAGSNGNGAEGLPERDLFPDTFLRLSIIHSRAAELLGPKGLLLRSPAGPVAGSASGGGGSAGSAGTAAAASSALEHRILQDVVMALLDLLSTTSSQLLEESVQSSSRGRSSSSASASVSDDRQGQTAPAGGPAKGNSGSGSGSPSAASAKKSKTPLAGNGNGALTAAAGGETAVVASELNAVMVLEWISNVFYANKLKLMYMWPKIHAMLKEILEDGIEKGGAVCPFFVERCVMFILRSGCELISTADSQQQATHAAQLALEMEAAVARGLFSAAGGAGGGGVRRGVPMSPTSKLRSLAGLTNDLQYVWQSMRLLRGLPIDISSQLSSRVGAALWSFMRVSPGVAAVKNLEEWYLVFSLLTSATTGAGGRPYVWAAVAFLVHGNLISDLNFTPCRHLLMRFLFGIFLDDVGGEDRMQGGQSAGGPGGPNSAWQLPAMSCMARLTCMALAGYISDFSPVKIGGPRGSRMSKENLSLHDDTVPKNLENVFGVDSPIPALPPTHKRLSDKMAPTTPIAPAHSVRELMTFPLPVRGGPGGGSGSRKSSAAPLTLTLSPGAPAMVPSVGPASAQATPGGLDQQSADPDGLHMTVARIRFSRAQEVEMLWLETCKMFADLSNSLPVETSRRATFSLQTILIPAYMAAMPDELWSRVLQELLARLPLSLVTANTRLVNPLDQTVAADCCLRCCNLVFEILVSQVKHLRRLPDFQSFWLRYTSILATNANLLTRGMAVHDEMLEMIAAIMRLLRAPVVPAASTHAVLASQSASAAAAGATAASKQSSGSTGAANTLAGASGSSSRLGFGLFSLWGSASSDETPTDPPSAPAAAEDPAAVGRSTAGPPTIALPVSANDDLAAQPSAAAAAADVGVRGSEGGGPVSYDDDGALLTLSWKTMLSLYPSLQSNLRLKNPQLVNDLVKYAEIQEKRNESDAIHSSSSSSSSSSSTTNGTSVTSGTRIPSSDSRDTGGISDSVAAGSGGSSNCRSSDGGDGDCLQQSTPFRGSNIRTIDARTHIV